MSLTSRLDLPQVKAVFSTGVVKPKFGPPPPTLVPPGPRAPRAGTAFDYALRFGLQGRGWGTMQGLVADNTLGAVRTHDALRPYRQQVEQLHAEANRLIALTPMTGPKLSSEAARACLMFATLDVPYRAGWTYLQAALDSPIEAEDLDNLHRLYAVVPWDEFRPEKALYLNPTFNEGSRRVGGADADLILDNMVIEIKTTKEQRVAKDHVNQCVAYALLANRFGVGPPPSQVEITECGIYLARAGALVRFPLEECLGTDPDVLLNALMDVRG